MREADSYQRLNAKIESEDIGLKLVWYINLEGGSSCILFVDVVFLLNCFFYLLLFFPTQNQGHFR